LLLRRLPLARGPSRTRPALHEYACLVHTALAIVAFVLGFLLVLATLFSLIRTLLLPRAIPARLARLVFLSLRFLFRIRAGSRAADVEQEAVLALYGPVALLSLLAVWLILAEVRFAGMVGAVGAQAV